MLKLPHGRVVELLERGDGIAFDAGKGRPMKEWVALNDDADVPWLGLAREALAFATGGPVPG